MIAYRENPRRTDWTPAHDDLLLTYVGKWRLAIIAKKLGRSPQACVQRLYLHRIALSTAAQRYAGMSIGDVAEALGVSKNHVAKWIRCGWLKSQCAFGVEKRYPSVDPDDLLTFIHERGALLRCITPNHEWADEVRDARHALDARLIASPELAARLCLATGSLAYLRRALGFPDPALRMGAGPSYYDRAAVARWLIDHPQYRLRAE